MYQIGEFSRISRLTIKALRYYDQEGILVPSGRSESGYQLYSQEDFKTAQLIVLLRELGFSIAELREVVTNCRDEGDLRVFLSEKRGLLAQQMRETRKLIGAIDRRLTLLQKVESAMTDYTFEIKNFPAVRVACLRTRAPYSSTGDQFAVLYKAVKNSAAGAPFNLYYDGEYAEPADRETCIPLKDGAAPEGAAVRTLPAFRGLCTRHLGPYDTLNLAYKALLDHSVEKNLALGLPAREIYLKGPGMLFKGNPDKYETEIVIPLK